MKVLHVISGLSRSAGGPSRSSQGLVAAECKAGVDAWIYTVNGTEPWMEKVRQWRGDIQTELVQFDLVHIHGIWHPGLHRVCVACRRQKIPYIIAPRGMLEPWSLRQKWLKKRLARFLYQDRDLKLAAALHATAQSEADQFRRLGFKNKIVISPNGVTLPDESCLNQLRETPKAFAIDGRHRALFVSRLHPKKGVRELIEAWAQVKAEGGLQDWCCELVYTLNGKTEIEYEREMKSLVQVRGVVDDFIFTGPLDDLSKWEAYARAELFVLPTYSENFGIVIAEALAMGLPVITTKGTPWQGLEELNAGLWIDLPPKESLEMSLRKMTNLSDATRAEMGHRGQALVNRAYTWQAVTRSLVAGYQAILDR